MASVRAFARGFWIGILPAMPGRGHRLPAARAIAATSAAIAAVVSMAGCDSHSKPQAVLDDPTSSAPLITAAPPATPATPASRSASGSGSVGPTSPPLAGESALNSAFPSAAARIPDAIETVRRFFDGLNHESDTGDEGPVISTFTTKCNLCGSEVYNIKSLLDGGHKLRGGHLHLLTIDSALATYSNVVSIDRHRESGASEQIDSNGQRHSRVSVVTTAARDLRVGDRRLATEDLATVASWTSRCDQSSSFRALLIGLMAAATPAASRCR